MITNLKETIPGCQFTFFVVLLVVEGDVVPHATKEIHANDCYHYKSDNPIDLKYEVFLYDAPRVVTVCE